MFAVNFAGMWLSGSRTALLCGVTGTIALIAGLVKERRSESQWLQRSVLWIAAGAVAVLAIMLLTGTTSPIRRALDIPPGRAGLVELWNRGGYGPIAVQMTREYPLTGVGAGGYRVLAPDYWRAMANDALPLDNAQNWWRHQIAELGMFGGALIDHRSRSSSRGACSRLARLRRGRGADRRCAVLLLGLGAASLFGMPTQNPLVLLLVLRAGRVAWTNRCPTPLTSARPRHAMCVVAWVVACVWRSLYAAGHVVLAAGSLNVVQRAQRANRDYVTGAYAAGAAARRQASSGGRARTRVCSGRRRRVGLVVRFWAIIRTSRRDRCT